MVNRREGADPSKDVGAWKHVYSIDPYEHWEKDLRGGGTAEVILGDASPTSDKDYWSHIEYRLSRDGSNQWAPDRLPAGTDRQRVMRETMKWMRRNQNWKPKEHRTSENALGLSFGSDASSGFF